MMSGRYWIKLYISTLESYDAQLLDDTSWRRMIELLLIAGKHNQGGVLPDMEQLLFRTRVDKKSLDDSLAKLMAIKFIAKSGNTYRICNWDSYQPRTTSTDRTRIWRERQKNGDGPEERDSLIVEWEKSIGPITAGVRDDLLDLVEEIQQFLGDAADEANSWIIAAIREARQSSVGRPNAKYVKAILERWMRDGFQADFKDDELSDDNTRTVQA
jgi:hypothetical protein